MDTKTVTCDIKSQDARRITFVASHEKIDRDGEVIVVAGIDTGEFEGNPVLLLQHNPRSLAVGRVTSLRKTVLDGAPALIGEATFPDRPQSNEVYADVKAGLLGAVSIGFRSLEVEGPRLPGQTGRTHVRTKLMEISLVTLPACQTCLVTHKSACACESVLPVAPSSADYSMNTLSRTISRGIAGAVFPHLDEADVNTETVNKLLRESVGDIVIDTVKREVRSRILYLTGRVD